jgi:acyl-CoA synthetase (AMP-forming)/AMP-acid ligase II
MIVEHAATQADAEAVVFESTRLSYGELNHRVNRLASGLSAMGLRKGDHVALLLGNCHQYMEAYYALSKAGMVAVPLNPDDYAFTGDPVLVKRSRSVGQALPGVSVAIRREDGSPCDPGQEGEITVSGDNVMLGYWRDPERTREALRDGWLWTGDMGFVDEDDYLYLSDRKSDMIISGGENVHPTETENALQEHPAVYEVAVVGVPDARWGEAVKAVVALQPGHQVSAGELIAFCKQRIAGYKCPKSVDFVDALPKSTVGKILRRNVKERYSENES